VRNSQELIVILVSSYAGMEYLKERLFEAPQTRPIVWMRRGDDEATTRSERVFVALTTIRKDLPRVLPALDLFRDLNEFVAPFWNDTPKDHHVGR